jgi:hypothetical protein
MLPPGRHDVKLSRQLDRLGRLVDTQHCSLIGRGPPAAAGKLAPRGTVKDLPPGGAPPLATRNCIRYGPFMSAHTYARPLSRRLFHKLAMTGALSAASAGALVTFARAALGAAWEKMDESEGITVYRKDVPGTALHAFKGEGIVDAPMEKIIWVLGDNEHRTEWVDRLKKSIILEKKSDYDFVLYQHFGSPPTISDRDFVYRARATSKADGSAVLEIQSVEHPKAPKTVGVRGHLSHSSYVLRRAGEGKTHVEVSVTLDPKGSLPKWIVNLVQKSWPKNTLVALRKQVKKPFVGQLSAPPVR